MAARDAFRNRAQSNAAVINQVITCQVTQLKIEEAYAMLIINELSSLLTER